MPSRSASASSIQGRKSPAAQLGKGEQQVAEVALGIDGDDRDAVDGGFFEQRQAEARLAAAGHADAHGVGGEVLGVVRGSACSSRLRWARSYCRPR